MELPIVILASVLVQFATMVLALRLIRISGGRVAWMFISASIILMVVRRWMAFMQYLAGEPPHVHALYYETVGLFGSIFMMAGVYSIRPLFESIRNREKELQRSRKRFRNLMDTALEGIWIIGTDGDTRYVNRRMAEMLQYTLEEMRGRPFLDFMDEELRAEALGRLEQRKQGLSEQHDFVFRRKDGTALHAMISTNPIWEDDKVVGALGMISDITEQKRLEKEREDLIRTLRDALANVKTLSGLLPICASCKKVRDDKGYWRQIESYIASRTSAEFSHGICPDCRKNLYPDIPL